MGQEAARLELEDIQSGILRGRPAPYAAAYLIFRIDDRKAGRELIRRAGTVVASAAHPNSPIGNAWATRGRHVGWVAMTIVVGLAAIGL